MGIVGTIEDEVALPANGGTTVVVVPDTDEVGTVLPVNKDNVEEPVEEGTLLVTLGSGGRGPGKEVD